MFDAGFTTKRDHSGIGLSLVQNIVRRCHGEIAVEQCARGGLAITTTFPA
jgi:sensor histidine kinase regulating citrate/malate metabolism